MRIISGSFRGKKLLEPKDIKTRPLKDIVKRSIFNIIYHSKNLKLILKIQIFWIYFQCWFFWYRMLI